MNSTARTIKNLVLATGFTAVALTVSVAPAQADGPQGPGVLVQPAIVDPIPEPEPEPEPQPEPQPLPDGPGEITDEPGCTHGCGGEVPDDKAGPQEGDGGEGPGDDPAEDAPLDQGCFTGCDLPEEPEVESIAIPDYVPVETPTRIDAGFGDQVPAGPSVSADNGAGDLTWLLAGGAAAVLAGAGAVARTRSRRTA